MTAINLDPTDVLAVFAFRRDHSPLWHWMRANFDKLTERAAGDRFPWIEMCEAFARQGLTNRAGGAPSPACAKLTWHRVKAYLAKQQTRLAAMREKVEEEIERKRALRDVRREAALAASRVASPPVMPWMVPQASVQPAPRPKISAMPPIVPPVPVLPERLKADPALVRPEQRLVVEGEPLAHPEDVVGLPSKAGYRSLNQWHRDAREIILKIPARERSVDFKMILLRATAIRYEP